jgi:hypothetical protein
MPHILIAFQTEGVKRLRTSIEIETVPAFAGLSADNPVGRIDLYPFVRSSIGPPPPHRSKSI